MAVTNTLLNHLRQQFISNVDHAQYRIGSTYTDAAINEKKVNGDGTVTIGFYISGSTGTVNLCSLLNANNQVLASRTENIELQSGTSDVYYFFTYNLYELT
ncbi:MAG: hypothetical protein ACI4WX_12865 [Aristaeellaceae bacterium]